jgi:hypothetical protein
MASSSSTRLSRLHQRRLRTYYRSAGWPCLDNIEVDLLAAGLIVRVSQVGGADTIRVTESGMEAIAVALEGNRRALGAHEALVLQVAQHVAAQGRLAFRGLPMRGLCGDAWRGCRPDVYSLRNTTVLDYSRPMIHEIKVSRADLLADIADVDKRTAYQALSSEFYYVMPAGMAQLAEIPFDCGVMYAGDAGLVTARPSEHRPVRPGFSEWMAIARRAAEPVESEELQLSLR